MRIQQTSAYSVYNSRPQNKVRNENRVGFGKFAEGRKIIDGVETTVKEAFKKYLPKEDADILGLIENNKVFTLDYNSDKKFFAFKNTEVYDKLLRIERSFYIDLFVDKSYGRGRNLQEGKGLKSLTEALRSAHSLDESAKKYAQEAKNNPGCHDYCGKKIELEEESTSRPENRQSYDDAYQLGKIRD